MLIKPKLVYSKICLKQPLKKDLKLIIKTNYLLMQVKRIIEYFSILQYFRPSLSYHLSLQFCFLCFEWPLKIGFTV